MRTVVYLNDREQSYIELKRVVDTNADGIWLNGIDLNNQNVHIPIYSILYTVEEGNE